METLSLNEGFRIEEPSVAVPWGLSRWKLRRLLKPHGLRKVDFDYYVISCTAMAGLPVELEFRYDSACRIMKYRLTFWLKDISDLQESYQDFQQHLEASFGSPTSCEPNSDCFAFPSYRWEIGDFVVTHSVYERFVLNESVGIRPKDYRSSALGKFLDCGRVFCWLFAPAVRDKRFYLLIAMILLYIFIRFVN